MICNLGCSFQEHQNEDAEIIELFLSNIKNESPKQLIESYFVPVKEEQKNKGLNQFREEVIVKLSAFLRENSFDVHKYEKLPTSERERVLIEGVSSKGVYVLKVKDNDDVFIKVGDNKIQSVSPILKGSNIVGWL
jgi:hypothetical protein